MSNLRELTDAELDLVSGGAQAVYKKAEPIRNPSSHLSTTSLMPACDRVANEPPLDEGRRPIPTDREKGNGRPARPVHRKVECNEGLNPALYG
jgi:hypothetical protein